MFIATSFRLAKTWRELKCPSIDDWIKKMWYTLLCIFKMCELFSIYSSHWFTRQHSCIFLSLTEQK